MASFKEKVKEIKDSELLKEHIRPELLVW